MEMVRPLFYRQPFHRALPEVLCMRPTVGSAVRAVCTFLKSHGAVTCRQRQWKHRERQRQRQWKRQWSASSFTPDAKEGMHSHHAKVFLLLFGRTPLAQRMRGKGRSCSALGTAVYALPAVAICLREGNRSDRSKCAGRCCPWPR